MTQETSHYPNAVIIDKDFTLPTNPEDQPLLPDDHIGYHYFGIHPNVVDWYREKLGRYAVTLRNPNQGQERNTPAIALPVTESGPEFVIEQWPVWVQQHLCSLLASAIIQRDPQAIITFQNHPEFARELGNSILAKRSMRNCTSSDQSYGSSDHSDQKKPVPDTSPQLITFNPTAVEELGNCDVAVALPILHEEDSDTQAALEQLSKVNITNLIIATVFTRGNYQKTFGAREFDWTTNLITLGGNLPTPVYNGHR